METISLINQTYTFTDFTLRKVWAQQGNWNPEARAEKISPRLYVVGREKTFKKEMIALIQQAREFTCISSFLFSDDQFKEIILKKAKEGVRTYVISSPETQLNKEHLMDDDPQIKKRIRETKEFLLDLAQGALIRTAPYFHGKFVIVDPKTNPRGYLSTANFTPDALEKNVELGVALTPDQVKFLYQQFCAGFWGLATHEVRDKTLVPIKSPPESLIPTLNHVDDMVHTTFIPDNPNIRQNNGGKTLKEWLLNTLDEKSDLEEVFIGAYGFEPDHEVTKRLISLLQEGVKVVVLTRPRPKPTHHEAITRLAHNGATVVGEETFHAKFLVVKRKSSIAGAVFTANIEHKGIEEGFESGAILGPDDATGLLNVVNAWERRFPWRFYHELQLGNHRGPIKLLQDGNLTNATIQPEPYVLKKEHRVESLDELDKLRQQLEHNQKKPSLPIKGDYYHHVIVPHVVIPPKVPSDARKVDLQELIPQVKEKDLKKRKLDVRARGKGKKSHLYLVISSLKELDQAIKQKNWLVTHIATERDSKGNVKLPDVNIVLKSDGS